MEDRTPMQKHDDSQGKRRVSYLSTLDFFMLNDACIRVTEALGRTTYLVGSATTTEDYRDIDVRSILADEDFDALFKDRESFWSLFCASVSHYLRSLTDRLHVDYQVQRMTEANEKFRSGIRIPIGRAERPYAGGGDAT